MAKLTRRGLIKQASVGAGFAGVLAVAATPGSKFLPTSAQATNEPAASVAAEPLVISVHDPSSGTLTVMRGERAVTVHNPALVRSLLSL